MVTKIQERVRCEECDEEGAINNMVKVELYDHPYDEVPRIAYFHRKIPAKFKTNSRFKWHDSCSELIYERGDFNYFFCYGFS